MAVRDTTRMSSKGQIVIPKHLREELGYETGELFTISVIKGNIVLKRVNLDLAEEPDVRHE